MRESGLTPGPAIVVSDENVSAIYMASVLDSLREQGWLPSSQIVPPGESSKSHAQLQHLYDAALRSGIDRGTVVVALGGGVVGDLAGFLASTLLRGLPLIHVPTTLVAQVDSSIGGKTGINHPAGKNLIGSFYQPRLILTDTRLLKTLPDAEWISGLAEVVKHALIDGASHAEKLYEAWDHVMDRDPQWLDDLIPTSAVVKVGVVVSDEHESGRRAILNLGHTVGHAVERTAGYGEYSHGQAVALGLAIALDISDQRYRRQDRSLAWALLRKLGWPKPDGLSVDEILHAVGFDKKRVGGVLRFVLLPEIGSPVVVDDVTQDDIRRAWHRIVRLQGSDSGTIAEL